MIKFIITVISSESFVGRLPVFDVGFTDFDFASATEAIFIFEIEKN